MNWHVSLRGGFAGVILTCAALVLVAGCDNDDRDEWRLVTLTRYNENVQGDDFDGRGDFELEDDDDFKVEFDIDGVFPEIRHAQFVHLLGTCPSQEAADTNDDGFVDFQEGLQAFGDIFFPLDSDLADGDINTFPLANEDGQYEYKEEVFFDDLLNAIGVDDEEDLDLENRTVVIYGVNPNETFPPTVASNNGDPVSETLPIACFEIERD